MLITTHQNDRAQRVFGVLENGQAARYELNGARAFDKPTG